MQQPLPFTVLKRANFSRFFVTPLDAKLQQPLPFTVLKRFLIFLRSIATLVATALTVYGIETGYSFHKLFTIFSELQQPLPFTVCAEGCEAAEEQSDDEARTSQVPEQSEGKTKVIWQ